jgi:5'-nucleotidase
MNEKRKQILLTNDDGVQSPGLWAAAEALSKLGYVTVAAPRDQASSTGRSMPNSSDGRIQAVRMQIGDQEWPVYAVGGTPAQTVLHAVLEIMPEPPDLVVSGINYGENVGNGIMISGTVGAALESASSGIPSMAVSLQLINEDYLGYSRTVDFSTAAYFTRYFAKILLEERMPDDVDLIKVDVPANATPETPWRLTRLSRKRYYRAAVRRTGAWDEAGPLEFELDISPENVSPDSDIYAIAFENVVSVTPLSLDMTSRVDFAAFEQKLKKTQNK